jgi:acyl carrier protein
MDETAIRKSLKRWIIDHSKAQVKGELGDDTPILEQGILSSLDIVEFVLYIESLRGEEVDTDAIEPEVFTSVDTLWTGFFAPLAPPAASDRQQSA